jgi:hypothetical protein
MSHGQEVGCNPGLRGMGYLQVLLRGFLNLRHVSLHPFFDQ